MAKKALTLSPGGSSAPKKTRKARKAKRTTAATSGAKRTSGKRRRRSRSAGTTSGGGGVKGLGGSLARTGLEAGKVVLPGAAASAAHGFFGDKLKLFGGRVDARLLAVASALAYKQFGKPSANVGDLLTKGAIGVLGSWLNEQAFDVGASQQTPAVPEVVPATEGMVIGNVYGGAPQTGAFWQSAEKRLAKKLARAKKKAEKKGLDWKDIREDAEDLAEKKGWGGEYGRDDAGPVAMPRPRPVGPYYGAAPVVAVPPRRWGGWFRGRRQRARARAI